jgi:predicted transcriptional regulator
MSRTEPEIFGLSSSGDSHGNGAGSLEMRFKSLGEFEHTFPPNYNIYFPTRPLSGVRFDIFMKILPEPASRIYSGRKKYELRKYVPKHSGLLFLLETGQTNAVTGVIYFYDFITDTVPRLWEKVGEQATTKQKFDRYFEGKDYGVALEIADFEKFDVPIDLDELYGCCPDMPKLPQPLVYMYTPEGGRLSELLRSRARHLVGRRIR